MDHRRRKIPIGELWRLRDLPQSEWIDHLINAIDYIKIPETVVADMLLGDAGSFINSRRQLAVTLLDAPDFVNLSTYHAFTILQDHVQELTSVAQVLGRGICFLI